MTEATISTTRATSRASPCIRSISGAVPTSAAATAWASCPTAVSVPVATTTPFPRPRATTAPGETEAATIRQGCARLAEPLRVFADRQRFTGQERFVDLQAVGGEKSQVGRYAVTRFEVQHIARDNTLGIDFDHLVVAQHGGSDVEQFLECS
jgi:hypothetical protein